MQRHAMVCMHLAPLSLCHSLTPPCKYVPCLAPAAPREQVTILFQAIGSRQAPLQTTTHRRRVQAVQWVRSSGGMTCPTPPTRACTGLACTRRVRVKWAGHPAAHTQPPASTSKVHDYPQTDTIATRPELWLHVAGAAGCSRNVASISSLEPARRWLWPIAPPVLGTQWPCAPAPWPGLLAMAHHHGVATTEEAASSCRRCRRLKHRWPPSPAPAPAGQWPRMGGPQRADHTLSVL